MNQRVECSVYDSLLGSWQYFNTVYYNTNVAIEDSIAPIIVFYTYFTNSWDKDSAYGYLIYDQELHQFKPVISHFGDIAHNGDADYWIGTFDGQVETYYEHIDSWQVDMISYARSYLYDILKHAWIPIGGAMSDETFGDAYVSVGHGGLAISRGSWHSNDREGGIKFYGPANQDSISTFITYLGAVGGNQDLYYMEDDGTWSSHIGFSAMDLGPGAGSIGTSDPGNYQCYGSVLYLYDNITASNYFAIYDDSLHRFAIDTVSFPISNINVKERVVAFTNASASTIYFEAFSPTLRAWVKDSAAAVSITLLYIQDGTVHWVDNGISHIAGYDDVLGWGNFNTPLLLNFHKTDLSSVAGYPLIYVRDYSIGTDSTWYDFGDGITTLPGTQHSLWHLYKVNGHYGNNFITTLNYSVCINAGTQSFCQSDSILMCALSGVASVSTDSICYGDSVTITLSGYAGNIQWQTASGSTWSNATGTGSDSSSYTILPTSSLYYRAMVTNGNCIPVFSNEIRIVVLPNVNPGTATITSDTICSGLSATLKLQGYSGSIRWQHYNGVVWINETGACNTCANYTVSPSATTIYRASVSTTFCGVDSSSSITLTVLPQLQNPAAMNDTVCNPDTMNLLASGGTDYCWYSNSNGDTLLDSGPVLSRFLYSTKTFYVRSVDGVHHAGPVDSLFGSTGNYSGQNYGLVFDAAAQVTIEKVYVYPRNTGSINIRLLNSSGIQLTSKYFSVSNIMTKTPLYLGFDVPPGTGYRLVADVANLVYNVSNVSFPYSSPSGGITITGSWRQYFSVDTIYLNFYDWVVSEGCHSNLVLAKGIVEAGAMAGNASVSNDSICPGTNDDLRIFGSIATGIQWQSNSGFGWINETGAGANLTFYHVYPNQNIQYRAVVTYTGGCILSDTSTVLNVGMLPSFPDPITFNDTICPGEVANLNALGSGTMSWFESNQNSLAPIDTGNIFAATPLTTTTYYVQASGGQDFNFGPPDTSLGSLGNGGTTSMGLLFHVSRPAMLEKVYVYPNATLNQNIQLVDSASNLIIDSRSIQLTAGSGKTPVYLGFTVYPGRTYQLVTTQNTLLWNSTNASYPYTAGGSPVEIVGYCDPVVHVGGNKYYYFYDWEVSEGCKSNFIPVEAVVLTPSIPIITINEDTLFSTWGLSFQWYQDGNLLSGDTLNYLIIHGDGSYAVSVMDSNGCFSASTPFIITGLDFNLAAEEIFISPNPATAMFVIRSTIKGKKEIEIFNAIGAKVYTALENKKQIEINAEALARGVYYVKVRSEKGTSVQKLIIQ